MEIACGVIFADGIFRRHETKAENMSVFARYPLTNPARLNVPVIGASSVAIALGLCHSGLTTVIRR